MINRAAVILRYREPAVRWINEADPYEDDPRITLSTVNQERTVYLIREEDAETSAAVDEWIELNYRQLFEAELEGWYTDPTLIGYVVYYPRADHMHLENVGVLPRFNGRGYGRRLIEHVEQAAIRNGLDAVELYTNEKMVENIAMYPKLGYTEVDRRIDKGFSRVFFRKTLNRGVEEAGETL